MGNPETPRYKILTTLNRYRALSYSDLYRESTLDNSSCHKYLQNLIIERIVIRWNFGGKYIIYAHCFIPWYEVKEIYDKKYLTRGHSRDVWRTKEKKRLEKVLKD